MPGNQSDVARQEGQVASTPSLHYLPFFLRLSYYSLCLANLVLLEVTYFSAANAWLLCRSCTDQSIVLPA